MYTALLPSIILAWKKLVETNTLAFLSRESVAKQKQLFTLTHVTNRFYTSLSPLK